MPIEEKAFVEHLAQQVLDNRTSLFLGAGGSQDAGYPAWSGLLEPLAEELGLDIDNSDDYYQLAQYFVNSFGISDLKRFINRNVNKNYFESNLVSELLDVGFANIWTTNFDKVIERNFQNRNVTVNSIRRDSDFNGIDLNRSVNIFKLNGDIDDIGNIVATRSDYENYRRNHELMITFFKRELVSSTFLFVGYSFTDHLALDCLSEIGQCIGGSLDHHYAIMRDKPNDMYFKYFINDLETRYRLHVLLIDENSSAVDALKKLNQRIRSRRVFISGALGYEASYETEQKSHQFSKEVTKALFDSDYRVVNGIGRHFGTHLLGYANKYLAENGVKNVERHLIIKTFPALGPDAEMQRQPMREAALAECGAAIFVFGYLPEKSTVSGVMQEYEISKKQQKIIIPIRCKGMISEQIWNEVKANITEYPYLEKRIDYLDIDTDPVKLAEIIVDILKEANAL